jgi:creatinine amidohydrolase
VTNSWGERTWRELDELSGDDLVAILPVGAVEAHGPHLPLCTDGIIAEAMAEAGIETLRTKGVESILLPTLDYTAAPFARGFAGTISIRPETVTALVVDIARSLAAHGIGTLAIANAHFDPANLASLHAAVDLLRGSPHPRLAFADLTRRPWALRLTEEFKSGACHAGCYEGSIVMASRPELVREEIRAALPAFAVSLSEAIAAGVDDFESIGGAEAYFGDPAAASVEEGEQTIGVLGEILAESVLAVCSD